MKMSTKSITITGLLAAISSVIMFIEFNIPFVPAFLKIDFSDVPALIGAVALSPMVGVFVLAVKNVIHIAVSSTGGIGELANFVIGCCFLLPPALLYKYKKKFGYLIFGGVIGVLFMTIGAGLFNYFVLIPLYSNFINLEAIIEMGNKVNSLINSKFSLVLYGVIPFNIIKGSVIALISIIILKYIPKTVICKI